MKALNILITFALIIILPMNALGCYEGLRSGHPILAALNATAFLLALWTLRRPADWAITGFCMWWVARKARQAIAFMESLKDEDNGNV